MNFNIFYLIICFNLLSILLTVILSKGILWPILVQTLFTISAVLWGLNYHKHSGTVKLDLESESSQKNGEWEKQIEDYQQISGRIIQLVLKQAVLIRSFYNIPIDVILDLEKSNNNSYTLEEIQNIYEKVHDSMELDRIDIKSLGNIGNLVLEIYHKIPYLNQLLENITRKTEEAVFNLIDKYQSIASSNTKAGKEADKNLESLQQMEGGKTFQTIISESKSAIFKNNEGVQKLVLLNQENREKLMKSKEWLNQINNIMVNIENISQQNKVISLNSFIESAKLGEQGKGLKVLAKEIEKLSKMTQEFTKEIGLIMRSFNTYYDNIIKEMESKTAELIYTIDTSGKYMEKIISLMIGSYELTAKSFIELKDSTAEVSGSLKNIMKYLQFQDITRQQIEHIGQFLTEIKTRIELEKSLLKIIDADMDQDNTDLRKRIKNELIQKVTVLDERKILI